MQSRTSYGVGLGMMGVVLTLVQFVQGTQQLRAVGPLSGTDQAIVFIFGTGPFILISLALVYTGYWMTGQETYEPDLAVILWWGVGTTVLFTSVAALFLFNQQIALDTLEQGQYVVVNQLTVGAAVGVLLGIYDARGRARQRELEHERDRIETFAGKAADINNYGRELNRAESIDEVSALCIEGLETLLGLTGTGFVAFDGDQGEVVNSTIVTIDDDELVALAGDSFEQEQATVTIHAGEETAVDTDEQILSMVVTQHEDSAVVLLAVAGDAVSFEDENVQLVELLITHAGTALDRIHARTASV